MTHTTNHPIPLPLGRLVATPGAMEAVPADEMLECVRLHAFGDDGELCAEDRDANTWARANGARVLSSYRTKAGEKFWIITEADRSTTTVLLPDEY